MLCFALTLKTRFRCFCLEALRGMSLSLCWCFMRMDEHKAWIIIIIIIKKIRMNYTNQLKWSSFCGPVFELQAAASSTSTCCFRVSPYLPYQVHSRCIYAYSLSSRDISKSFVGIILCSIGCLWSFSRLHHLNISCLVIFVDLFCKYKMCYMCFSQCLFNHSCFICLVIDVWSFTTLCPLW